MIKHDANVKAYESTESLGNFDNEQMSAYRKDRLCRYHPICEFIRRHGPSNEPLSVVEIGSGSSALLYSLAIGKALKHGLGIELSKSRFEFAELWKAQEGFGCVENRNANFAETNIEEGRYDWFLVVDNTFTYLHPENTAYPHELLARGFLSLKSRGRIVLDFFNYGIGLCT